MGGYNVRFTDSVWTDNPAAWFWEAKATVRITGLRINNTELVMPAKILNAGERITIARTWEEAKGFGNGLPGGGIVEVDWEPLFPDEFDAPPTDPQPGAALAAAREVLAKLG